MNLTNNMNKSYLKYDLTNKGRSEYFTYMQAAKMAPQHWRPKAKTLLITLLFRYVMNMSFSPLF